MPRVIATGNTAILLRESVLYRQYKSEDSPAWVWIGEILPGNNSEFRRRNTLFLELCNLGYEQYLLIFPPGYHSYVVFNSAIIHSDKAVVQSKDILAMYFLSLY